MAVSCGLHRETNDGSLSLFDREHRRRVFWSVYCYEQSQSVAFGKPPSIYFPSITASRPLNIHDAFFTPNSASLPPEAEEPTIYSGLVMQWRFAQITAPAYERILGQASPTVWEVRELDGLILDIYGSLPDYWKIEKRDNLPERFLLPLHALFWRIWNFRMVL